MPAGAKAASATSEAEITRFAARYHPFLASTAHELLQDSTLAGQVLGEVQIFRELEEFQRRFQTPVKVKFIDWNDAFRYFADYVSDPSNPPVVAQLGHTWAGYFRSLGVVAYEQRYNWDIRMLWYWKHLVDPDQVADEMGFLQACRRLKRAPPPELAAPFAITTAPTWDLLHDLAIWLHSAGLRSLISVDRKLGIFPWSEALLSGPEGERAAGFLITLAREGLVALPEEEGSQSADDFLEGKYAMTLLGAWVAGRARARWGDDWESRIGAGLPPALGTGSRTTVKLGSLLVVLDPGRGRDSTWIGPGRRLVDFLTSAESQRRSVHDLGDLPGNPEALAALPHYPLFSEALERARAYPELPEWGPVVENLVTRDNLYAFWKRLAALSETQGVASEQEQQQREKLILAALQSAQAEINRNLSLGKLSALWPWLVGMLLALAAATCGSIWRRRVERRESRRKLEESEAKYRDLYDHAPEMFCSVDVATGEIVECNQTLLQKMGYSREEVIGRHIFDMYHPDCREAVEVALDEFRRTGQVGELELKLQTKEGRKLVVSVNVSAIRDEQGRVVRTRSVWRDITQRKQAEEIAEQRRQELTHVARLATMGELAASLAHELNQPLTAIVSNAQAAQRLLARQNPDLDEARNAVQDIARQGQRAGEVIQAIRALLKKEPVEAKELDPNEIIREVLFLLDRQPPLRNLSLRLELAPLLPPVLGDPVQLQQAIMNLILNASEAMSQVRDRARELVIRTRSNGSREVEISVQDSGTGLEEPLKDRIFDPFFSTKPGGLGMGLSVTRTIIESHGGRIWVASDPGVGTTFSFTLPVAEVSTRGSIAGSPEPRQTAGKT